MKSCHQRTDYPPPHRKKKVGVTRKTAARLLAELCQRAEQVDNDSQFLYGISRLAVFGSYVNSAKLRLGDIDIAVEWLRKEPDAIKHRQLDLRQEQESRSRDWLKRLYWPQEKVIRALRGGHSSFSFHEWRELKSMAENDFHFQYQELYANPQWSLQCNRPASSKTERSRP